MAECDLDGVIGMQNMLASQRERLGGDLAIVALLEEDIAAVRAQLRRTPSSTLLRDELDRLGARLARYKED